MPPFLDRLRAAYALLGRKAPDPSGALLRLRPELQHREHLTAGLSAAAGLEVENFVGHAKIYQQYVWVRKAVGAIVTALAPLPQRVVGPDGVVVAHELNAVLEQPNDQMDGALLREFGWVHKLLGGEFFREVVDDARGRPRELWPRRPDEVWVLTDELRAAYPAPAGYRLAALDGDTLPPAAIIHERFVHPLNDYRGISVIGAARHEIAVDLGVLLNSQRTIRDGSRQYAITSDDVLAPTERDRVEAELAQKYGRDRPILLEGGQSIQRFGDAPDDLEWLAARDYSREGVGALFGVPDEIMGFGRDTYENFETALRVFWLLTLLPMSQRHDATMTHFFTSIRPVLRPGQRIATDLTGVSVLQEALGPKLEHAAQLFGLGVPYNTVERLLRLGTGPILGGDVGYLSAALVPASLAAQGGALPDAAARADAPRQKAARVAKSQAAARALQRVRAQVAARLEPRVAQFFDDLAARVVARARAAEKAGAPPAAKALPTVAQLLLPGDETELGGIFRVFVLELVRASWEVWNQVLDVELAFDERDPAVVAALAQSGDRITAIAETTREAVRALLQHGADAGWTIDQLVRGDDERPGLRDLVAETFRGRARTIARTELGTAQQVAACARYEGAGVSRVLVLDNGFDDSDPACTRLNGTTQTLAWARANPLQHPNCVRAFAPAFED